MKKIRNKKVRCKKCRTLYNFISLNEPLCPACKKEQYDQYLFVREYVKNNPKISLADLSKHTGVSVTIISGYLKDRMLDVVGFGSSGPLCRHCGAILEPDNSCPRCVKKNDVYTEADFLPFKQ